MSESMGTSSPKLRTTPGPLGAEAIGIIYIYIYIYVYIHVMYIHIYIYIYINISRERERYTYYCNNDINTMIHVMTLLYVSIIM